VYYRISSFFSRDFRIDELNDRYLVSTDQPGETITILTIGILLSLLYLFVIFCFLNVLLFRDGLLSTRLCDIAFAVLMLIIKASYLPLHLFDTHQEGRDYTNIVIYKNQTKSTRKPVS